MATMPVIIDFSDPKKGYRAVVFLMPDGKYTDPIIDTNGDPELYKEAKKEVSKKFKAFINNVRAINSVNTG